MLQLVLPQILKAFRSLRSLSQEAAAELARVSVLTWRRWESGKHAPNGCQFEDLARALEKTPLELGAMIAGALNEHFTAEKAARESAEGDEAEVSRAFLDVVCGDLGRASAHLEVVAHQAKLAGDARVIAKVLSSMDEARAALDRVYALLWTVGTAGKDEAEE